MLNLHLQRIRNQVNRLIIPFNLRYFSKFVNPKNIDNLPSQHLHPNETNENIIEEKFQTPIPRSDVDISFLVNSYTSPALAAAFQDRDRTLHSCAKLLREGKLEELKKVLSPFEERESISSPIVRTFNVKEAFNSLHLQYIKKRLNRLPRQISKVSPYRASVLIPLCHVDGIPSVLFTLRSNEVGRHKGEVCFPGGMVDDKDISVVDTCLREMEEEIGIEEDVVQVLGILRCDWSHVVSMTGVAVTPVVGYIGEVSHETLPINRAEVETCFTIPLDNLINVNNWIYQEGSTPICTAGPHIIWGLTAYLLDQCVFKVLHVK